MGTLVLTIVLPIVLINQIGKMTLDGKTGNQGTVIHIQDNETISLSGTATSTMALYRWDWEDKGSKQAANDSQTTLFICFDGSTLDGVNAYLTVGNIPPTTINYKAKISSIGSWGLQPCFASVDSTNCGGSLYIGVEANTTISQNPFYSLRVTREVSTWCNLSKGILMAMGIFGVCILAGAMGCVTCCCCVGFVMVLSSYRKHHHYHYTRVDIHSGQAPINQTAYPPSYGYQQPQPQVPSSYPQPPMYQQVPPPYAPPPTNPSAPLLAASNNPKLNSVD